LVTTRVPAGITSISSSRPSTSTGASASMPSTAWPWAILSNISPSVPSTEAYSSPSRAARAFTSAVISSSRQGEAVISGSSSSIERWSATEKGRISSIVSPKKSMRTGCSLVGGKTSTMPPRTQNSPRRSTRSTRM
jgi:hypothetical protein